MKIDPNNVYIYRTSIDRAEAPFEIYRDLAYTALSALELDQVNQQRQEDGLAPVLAA